MPGIGVVRMFSATCPDCEDLISFEFKPRLGQRLMCPHCDADLEVVSTSPLELDWAYDESDEDWEDEEDWDTEEEWEERDWEDTEEDS